MYLHCERSDWMWTQVQRRGSRKGEGYGTRGAAQRAQAVLCPQTRPAPRPGAKASGRNPEAYLSEHICIRPELTSFAVQVHACLCAGSLVVPSPHTSPVTFRHVWAIPARAGADPEASVTGPVTIAAVSPAGCRHLHSVEPQASRRWVAEGLAQVSSCAPSCSLG